MAQWLQWYNVKHITLTNENVAEVYATSRIPVLCTTIAAYGADRNLGDFASLKNFVQDHWSLNLYDLIIPSFHTIGSSFAYDLGYAQPPGGWGAWHCSFNDVTDVTAHNVGISGYKSYAAIQINDNYAYTYLQRIELSRWQNTRCVFTIPTSGQVTFIDTGFAAAESQFACYQQTRRMNYSMIEGQIPMLLFLNPDDQDTPTHSACISWGAVVGGPGGPSYSCTINSFQALQVPTSTRHSINPESVCGRVWVEGSSPYSNITEESDAPGGESTGTGDWTPEDIPEPDLPTYSSVDTGFTRIYNPTLAQLQDFAAYMWTDTSIWSTIWNKLKQYFEDPMDAFIALNMLPCEVPNASAPETVKICFLSTGKQMYPITNQFVKVDCGSVNLTEIWGSALDYSPNTKIDLFLPFIGTVPIDPDEVMGHTVKVKYTVDVVTGNCLATVAVDGENTDRVLYQFSGHCAISIPFSSADFSAYVSAAISAAKAAIVVGTAGAAAGAIGAAGAAAPAAASGGSAASSASTALVPVGLPAPNAGAIGLANPAPITPVGQPNSGDTASFGHLSAQKLDGVGTSPTAKPSFTHTGGFTGNTGFMGVKYPYFIIKSPRMVNPDQYGQMNGYPSMVYTALSACTGFTQVQQIHLGAIDATANERDEILSFLKSGVIL